VLDHLIIGRGQHTSLRDLGLIPPEAKGTGADLGLSVSPRHSVVHDDNPTD
jgi:hypothetical protein